MIDTATSDVQRIPYIKMPPAFNSSKISFMVCLSWGRPFQLLQRQDRVGVIRFHGQRALIVLLGFVLVATPRVDLASVKPRLVIFGLQADRLVELLQRAGRVALL